MKKPTLIAGVVLILTIAGSVVVGGVALARSDQQHRAELKGLESQLEETNALLTRARADATEARADSDAALEDLEQTQDRLSAATTALARADSNVNRLRKIYNSLYSDFQRLYDLAIVLVGQGSYQPSFGYNPIHCTTSTISGYYVYTDCS